jgi:hypothetical protein
MEKETSYEPQTEGYTYVSLGSTLLPADGSRNRRAHKYKYIDGGTSN